MSPENKNPRIVAGNSEADVELGMAVVVVLVAWGWWASQLRVVPVCWCQEKLERDAMPGSASKQVQVSSTDYLLRSLLPLQHQKGLFAGIMPLEA
jgi:hypothetical protein